MNKFLVCTIAKNRTDKGKTLNYHVYECAHTVNVKNMKGEVVTKNALLGGNGNLSIANEFSAGIDSWVLIPKAEYDRLSAMNKPINPSTKKGK